jgi:ATPase family AAA domain-containing protein 1
MVPMRELMRRAGDNKGELFRMHEEVRQRLFVCGAGVDVWQGFELRPLVLEDFFQTDGTSALPPREVTLEEVLEKLAS